MSNDRVRKGYHCVWQIHYHIVFPVRFRKALFYDEVVDIIKETGKGIEKRYAIEMEAMGCDGDHIHFLPPGRTVVKPGVNEKTLAMAQLRTSIFEDEPHRSLST